jgi:hypothetical protein
MYIYNTSLFSQDFDSLNNLKQISGGNSFHFKNLILWKS